MRPKTPALLVFVFVLGGLAGCSSARLIQADRSGGIVAIPHNSNLWPTYYREKAEALIQARCPNGYEIVSEEEFVTGTVTHTDSETKSQETPTLLLGGADGSTRKTNKNGERHSETFGGLAIPLGENEQRTQQTTSTRNVTEWRIIYRAR